MTRIAVVGVGAIGGVCAANLAAAGHDVVCCVRTPFDELVVELDGCEQRVVTHVETDPARVGPTPWVLLATKAHQIAGADRWLRALVDQRTHVAVLQNGVEHLERVAAYVEAARVVPVVIACPATAIGPGHVVQRSAARLSVPDDAGGQSFAQLFDGSAIAVTCETDWATAAWRKLCMNVTGGALAALAGVPLAEVRHPRLLELARLLALECARAARAERADVSDDFAEDVAAKTVAAPSVGTPSTLTDRRRGRPLEVDARNGAVVRVAARHGIPTPANAHAAELMARAHLDPTTDLLPELASQLLA